jgi:hypothetical protein
MPYCGSTVCTDFHNFHNIYRQSFAIVRIYIYILSILR